MVTTRNDCFFFVDMETPEEERKISVMHVHCRNEKMPGAGWFYRGSVEGYGPFDYICAICGGMIHSGKQGCDEQKEHIETGCQDARRQELPKVVDN